MASYDAALNLIVNGGSKVNRIIDQVGKLENIINSIKSSPIEINTQKAVAAFDKFDAELKAIELSIKNQKKALETASVSANKYIDAIASTQSQLSKLNPNTKKYNQVLERQQRAIAGLAAAQKDLGDAERKLERDESRLSGAEKRVEEAVKARRATEAISSLADEYLRLGAAQQKGASGKALANQTATISQLNAQAEALKTVGNNSDIASSQFNRFAIASQLASQKVFQARQKQLSALAFGLSADAPRVNVGRGGESSIAAARSAVSSLVSSYGTIVKSEAALSAYGEQLRSLQSLVPYTSNEFRVLEEAIAGVNQEVSQIGLRGQKSAIQSLSGPATDLGSLRAFQLKESFQKKISDQLNLQESIQERISQATLFDFQKKKLTLQLDEAVAALAENRLGDAQRLTREIDRQRISMERMNRAAQKPQVFGALGTAFLPVTGKLPGEALVPGSPAAKAAGAGGTRGQAFRAGGPGAVTAALSAPKRVESLVRSAQLAQEKLTELEIRGIDVTGEKASVQKIINSLKEKDLQISDQLLNNADDELNLIRDVLRLEKQRLANQRLLDGGSKGKAAAPGGTGLEAALKSLEEARSARQKFLGDVSPTEAIDKIVREFNQGKPAQNITDTFASGLKKGASRAASSAKSFATAATQAIKDVFGIASPSRFMIEIVQNLVSTYIAEMQKSYPRIQAATNKAFGEESLIRNVKELRATGRGFEFTERPSRGFRPFREAQGFGRGTEGATQEFNNMMLDFRKQIAELTTQPEIFSNLLRGLPDARITTDLIGAANRRALASELPSFMPTQRMMGPGELEREIAKAFADYVRTIRTPDPWVGLVGDYREFINKVIAQTQRLSSRQVALPGVRIAGALPAAEQRITSVQQQRIQRAYERSAQRQLAVLSGDAFAGAGRPALSAANFGFMADPTRIGRLSGIGRALPPAIDVAASAVDDESRNLREAVRNLFDRVSQGLRSAFGGSGGGRPPVPPVGGGGVGGGGSANRAAQLLGLDAIADISRVSTRELEALSAAASELRAVLDPTIEGFDRLDNQLRETIGQIGRQLERRAPDAGFLTRRFGPRTARGLSEGLIGGAFPLLFGQGAGAAVGGAAGGFAGGFAGGGLGFGLSLVGTALGTAFDQLSQAAQETGRALKYPAEAFEQLKEAGLLASRQQEYYISKLIEAGRLTEAAGEIQAEIIKKIGVQGVEDLQRLGESSSNLGKAWAEFNLQLQAAVADPLADLLDWVTKIVNISNQRGREEAGRRDLFRGLSGADQVAVNQRISQEIQARGGAEQVGVQGIQDIRQQVLEEFASRSNAAVPAVQLTPEQRDKEAQAKGVTKELEAQNDLLSKQLALTGLSIERDGDKYISAAKAVALQEYDNELLKLKNSWIGKAVTQQQKMAQERAVELDYSIRLKQINEEIARRQEEVYQNSLQAEMALYQQRQKSIELIVRIAEFNSGEEAGLRQRLSLADNLQQQKLSEFYVEEELALIAAQKNGTYEQTARLFAERLLVLEKELDLEKRIVEQRIIQLDLNRALSIEDTKRQAADPFVQFRQAQKINEQFTKTYLKLLRQGIEPAEAERLANFERLSKEQLEAADNQAAIAQSTYDEAVARGLIGDALKTYADNLERARAAQSAAQGEVQAGPGPAQAKLPGLEIQEFISNAEVELRNLEAVAVRVSQGIGDAVGDSLANGITGLIEGTTTAKEIFAGFLKDVGQILIREGTRMIAMYIAIGIAKQFAGFFSSGVSGGAGGAGASDLPTAITSTSPIAANGAYFANGIAAFAKGGMFTNSIVSSPTLFQFADGGVTRTGLMGEAGPEAIMPLKRGADGKLGVAVSENRAFLNSVSDASDSSSGADESGSTESATAAARASIRETERLRENRLQIMSQQSASERRYERERIEQMASTPGNLNIKYESQVINNVEYVTRDQAERMAAQSALRGRELAINSLQTSVKTRKRVGIA